MLSVNELACNEQLIPNSCVEKMGVASKGAVLIKAWPTEVPPIQFVVAGTAPVF